MEFKSPYLLLLLLVVPLCFYVWRKHQKQAAIRFPSTGILGDISLGLKAKLYQVPLYLRLLAIGLLMIALAGPRKILDQTMVTTEGVDIILTLDVSGSMAAEDFVIQGQRKNRLEVVKSVVKEFIDQRVSDRLGLVIFGTRAYVVCPLTTDHHWLKENLNRVKLGIVQDGTAIGSGISSSLLRLKESKAKSRIIVLLTDGVNNAGSIDPVAAGNIAQTMGIKIYTIGAGTQGLAPMPVQMFGQRVYQNVQVEIDERSLKEIATMTNAKYFRATDTDSLREIYKEIDALEKTNIDQTGYRQYQELFWIFVVIALGLIALDLILSNTLLFKIP